MTSQIVFPHKQSAHCESGVTSNLLRFQGIHCSEALAFGMGEGLFFGYLPFIKLNKLPLTTFRCRVGNIFKIVTKRLGVQVEWQRFRSQSEAMDTLDCLLEAGIPVGCQTGAYWLPYFPPAFRFHFNMHNLVVIGRDGDEYRISDPVFENIVSCRREDLQRARFAKGALAPKGAMYYLQDVPSDLDLRPMVLDGLKAVCKTMLKTPVPFLGVRGIHFLANRLEKWPVKLGDERAALFLGQLIRMQEEIGTGGGGFRFMFAAFLQEAASLLEREPLHLLSEKMTLVGDTWRQFASSGARVCKGRAKEIDNYHHLADILRQCAESERDIYINAMQILA